MFFIYVLVVLHTVLANDHNKVKVFYNIEDAESHFQQFMLTYNKTYISEIERATRFEIFKENLVKINKMNQNDLNCPFAINHFADLSSEEFIRKYTGLRLDKAPPDFEACRVVEGSVFQKKAPAAFDWRAHIDMLVKNQGPCGSCYAFSATGNVEAQYAMKYNKSVSLSVQQVVDCDDFDGGCEDGGLPANVLRYLIQNGGQAAEETYPYVGKTQDCQYISGTARVNVLDCINFRITHEDMIKKALFENGPLAVVLDATSLQNYHRGEVLSNCVYTDLNHAVLLVGYGTDKTIDSSPAAIQNYHGGMVQECVYNALNHAVLLVGYETDQGIPYWIIKNSYSPNWGEGGYLRLKRGINACGLTSTIAALTVE